MKLSVLFLQPKRRKIWKIIILPVHIVEVNTSFGLVGCHLDIKIFLLEKNKRT